ncbi:MAG: hypothetical protein RLP02_22210 [Coleofasciculus sp. C2-GNP5-27]
MKAGTSSFYADISRHPEIFFPEKKEPNGLHGIAQGDLAASRAYADLYAGRQEIYLGDASTGYSKFPMLPCPAEAASVQREEIRVLYMLRDPIRRIERHIAHHIGNGETRSSALDVFENPEYAFVSAYEMQLSLWKKWVPREHIMVFDLKEYKENRNELIARVFDFLDLPVLDLASLDGMNINRGFSRRSAYRSRLRFLIHSQAYGVVREYIPRSWRRALAYGLLPPANPPDVNLNKSEVAFLCEAIQALDNLDAPGEAEAIATFELVRARHIASAGTMP